MSLRIIPAAARRADGILPIAVVRGGKRGGHLLIYDPEPDGDELVTLDPGEVFELIPETRPGMRSVFHITAPSGAGKSTVAAGFARNFADMWPSGRIIVVSSTAGHDPAFDGIEHTRVEATTELDDLTMATITALSAGEPSLVIFDDIEGLPKDEKRSLEAFQQRCLETGRRAGIHVLSLFHRAAAGNSTKISLAESNGLLYFPSSNGGNLGYVLAKHFGISPQIRGLLKTGWGRWCLLRVDGAPAYILGERRASLYDGDKVGEALQREKALEKQRVRAQVKREAAGAL